MEGAREALRQIGEALREERYEDALRAARDAVRRFPQDPEILAAQGDASWCLDDLEGARRAYEMASAKAPEMAPFQADVARVCFAMADFPVARDAAMHAQELEDTPEALDVLCRLAERDGDIELADRLARQAHALDPEDFPLPYRVGQAEFRRLVTEAVNEIPESFQTALAEDVAIFVDPVPSEEVLESEKPPLDPGLLGLYVGVPLPQREESLAAPTLPDRIHLFQHNLEHEARDRDELVEQIRVTLFHEVGHYFGFSDEELEERDFG